MNVVIMGRVITARGLRSKEFGRSGEKSVDKGLGEVFQGEKKLLH